MVSFFAMGILGCASGQRIRHKHEFTLSPGQEFHQGLEKAMLLPVNATNEKPVKGLDIANDRIAALIARHLESKGITVDQPAPGPVRKALDDATRKVRAGQRSGAPGGVASATVRYTDVVPVFLDGLGAKSDFVILADVVMRDATYQGTRMIVWDGVRRREKVTGVDMSGYGDVPAASLAVWIYLADGTLVFSGIGGLETIYRVDRESEDFVQREDLFQDERNLREGICIAFYPWFGREEFCSR